MIPKRRESRRQRLKEISPKGSFAHRHGFLLIYRLDKLVDSGEVTEEVAFKMAHMAMSKDEEMSKLGNKICLELVKNAKK